MKQSTPNISSYEIKYTKSIKLWNKVHQVYSAMKQSIPNLFSYETQYTKSTQQ